MHLLHLINKLTFIRKVFIYLFYQSAFFCLFWGKIENWLKIEGDSWWQNASHEGFRHNITFTHAARKSRNLWGIFWIQKFWQFSSVMSKPNSQPLPGVGGGVVLHARRGKGVTAKPWQSTYSWVSELMCELWPPGTELGVGAWDNRRGVAQLVPKAGSDTATLCSCF